MTRNTFFAAMMFCLMAMCSTNMNAQHRGGMGHPGARREMRMGSRHDMNRHNMGYRDMGRHNGYREMHGHRWDHDGWMVGYHGRVRHFADGRWGYFRDGAWYYYDCFYEPSFYYARPLSHFHAHILSPRGRRIAAAAVGTAAVVGLIGALCR